MKGERWVGRGVNCSLEVGKSKNRETRWARWEQWVSLKREISNNVGGEAAHGEESSAAGSYLQRNAL
jgi:hypothetical protein